MDLGGTIPFGKTKGNEGQNALRVFGGEWPGFVQIEGDNDRGVFTELVVSLAELGNLGESISGILESPNVSKRQAELPARLGAFCDVANDEDIMIEVEPCCNRDENFPAGVVFSNSWGEHFALVLSREQMELLKDRLAECLQTGPAGDMIC
jgi:hypothetical protein